MELTSRRESTQHVQGELEELELGALQQQTVGWSSELGALQQQTVGWSSELCSSTVGWSSELGASRLFGYFEIGFDGPSRDAVQDAGYDVVMASAAAVAADCGRSASGGRGRAGAAARSSVLFA